MTALTFTVPGHAAPQGSKRHIGNGQMIESSREVGPWRERVALAARAATTQMFTGAVVVRIDFVLRRPLSTPKRSTPPAIKKPDVDKLARAVLDALTDVLLDDDSRVVELRTRKRLAEIGESPRADITVTDELGVWV